MSFLFGNVKPNGEKLFRFAGFIKHWDNNRIRPVQSAVFCSVHYFSPPDLSGENGVPRTGPELFRMISGVYDAVVLPDQLFPGVLGHSAEILINVNDKAPGIGNRSHR